MNFHDFEKFNGQQLSNIRTLVEQLWYGVSTVKLGDIKVVEDKDKNPDIIEYRLYDENNWRGGKVIGYAKARPNGDYIFEASENVQT